MSSITSETIAGYRPRWVCGCKTGVAGELPDIGESFRKSQGCIGSLSFSFFARRPSCFIRRPARCNSASGRDCRHCKFARTMPANGSMRLISVNRVTSRDIGKTATQAAMVKTIYLDRSYDWLVCSRHFNEENCKKNRRFCCSLCAKCCFPVRSELAERLSTGPF